MPATEVSLRYLPSDRKRASDRKIEDHLLRLVEEGLVLVSADKIREAARKRREIVLTAVNGEIVGTLHRRTANKSLGRMIYS